MSESIANMLSGIFDDVCFLMCIDDDREKLDDAFASDSRIIADLRDARITLLSLSNRYRKKYPEMAGMEP